LTKDFEDTVRNNVPFSTIDIAENRMQDYLKQHGGMDI
jgi:hypothetical protein